MDPMGYDFLTTCPLDCKGEFREPTCQAVTWRRRRSSSEKGEEREERKGGRFDVNVPRGIKLTWLAGKKTTIRRCISQLKNGDFPLPVYCRVTTKKKENSPPCMNYPTNFFKAVPIDFSYLPRGCCLAKWLVRMMPKSLDAAKLIGRVGEWSN